MIERDPSDVVIEPAGAHGDRDAARLAVLRLLADQPNISQRELSSRLKVSLGKTHYVLHALLDRGLIKMRNFRRSDRKLAYAYALTPSGLAEKMRLTRRFLLRKEAEYEALARTISALRDELEVVSGRSPAQSTRTSPKSRRSALPVAVATPRTTQRERKTHD